MDELWSDSKCDEAHRPECVATAMWDNRNGSRRTAESLPAGRLATATRARCPREKIRRSPIAVRGSNEIKGESP